MRKGYPILFPLVFVSRRCSPPSTSFQVFPCFQPHFLPVSFSFVMDSPFPRFQAAVQIADFLGVSVGLENSLWRFKPHVVILTQRVTASSAPPPYSGWIDYFFRRGTWVTQSSVLLMTLLLVLPCFPFLLPFPLQPTPSFPVHTGWKPPSFFTTLVTGESSLVPRFPLLHVSFFFCYFEPTLFFSFGP